MKTSLIVNPRDGTVDRIEHDIGTWVPGGYRVLKIDGNLVALHRVIWENVNGPVPDGMVVDHINGDTTDNRIHNLRVITRRGNRENSYIPQSNSRTGAKGVSVCKQTGKFFAQISSKGVRYFLGRFDTMDEAVKMYECAVDLMHEYGPRSEKGGQLNAPKRNPPKRVKGFQHPGGETTTRNTGISV